MGLNIIFVLIFGVFVVDNIHFDRMCKMALISNECLK